MTDTVVSSQNGLRYQWLPWSAELHDVIAGYDEPLPADMSAYWLDTTAKIMTTAGTVFCHCLKDNNDTIILLLPLVHQPAFWGPKFKSLSCFYSSLSSCYGVAEPNHIHLLLHSIVSHWRCSSIELEPLAEYNPLLQALYSRERQYSFVCYQRFVNYYHLISTDYTSYLQQRPALLRQTLKRKQKKISQLKATCQIFSSLADITQHLPYFHQVYRQSWKPTEYSTDFIDNVCIAAAVKDEVRLGVLVLDEQIIAAQIWFVRAGVASIFKLAYVNQFQYLSPGTVLSAAMFQQVIDNDGVSCIDYGIGDEPYKADWMSEKRQRYGVLLFNLNCFGGWLSWCRHRLPPLLRRILSRRRSKV